MCFHSRKKSEGPSVNQLMKMLGPGKLNVLYRHMFIYIYIYIYLYIYIYGQWSHPLVFLSFSVRSLANYMNL